MFMLNLRLAKLDDGDDPPRLRWVRGVFVNILIIHNDKKDGGHMFYHNALRSEISLAL